MIATRVSTVRESVILLLKKSGHSHIEAVEKWDSVYSKEFFQARAGKTVTWIIGEYTVEFTKSGNDTEPEVIRAAPDTGRGRGTVILLFLGGLVSLIAALIAIF